MPSKIGPHLLGRLPSPPDSRDYMMKRALSARDASERASEVWRSLRDRFGATAARASIVWSVSKVLDQGDTAHCIGFSAAHWGISDPVNSPYDAADADAIYYECKVLDGEPGNEDGSYVRTVAKVLRTRGRMNTYYFADSVDDMRNWLRVHGPIIMGTDWTENMFDPDSKGFVAITGEPAGGHAYLCIGDSVEENAGVFLNSWSEAWGQNGRFKMKWDDVSTLLKRKGEACAGLEQPL